jgi:hypothetical protein
MPYCIIPIIHYFAPVLPKLKLAYYIRMLSTSFLV